MAEGTEGLQTNESGSRATPVEEAGAWEGELNFFTSRGWSGFILSPSSPSSGDIYEFGP